jgi:hypothetical protein
MKGSDRREGGPPELQKRGAPARSHRLLKPLAELQVLSPQHEAHDRSLPHSRHNVSASLQPGRRRQRGSQLQRHRRSVCGPHLRPCARSAARAVQIVRDRRGQVEVDSRARHSVTDRAAWDTPRPSWSDGSGRPQWLSILPSIAKVRLPIPRTDRCTNTCMHARCAQCTHAFVCTCVSVRERAQGRGLRFEVGTANRMRACALMDWTCRPPKSSPRAARSVQTNTEAAAPLACGRRTATGNEGL